MEDRSPRRRPPWGIVISLVAIALGAGSATAWFTWRSISPRVPTVNFPEIEIEGEALPEGFEVPTSAPIEVPNPPETDVAAEPAPRQETIYWLSTQGTEVALAPVDIDLPSGQSPEDLLTLAFSNLMEGPQGSKSNLANSIPEQTELLALETKFDGVYVDLSGDFIQGGGSLSMIGRLAQVVYTATTLDPNQPVWISVDGEPLTVLGGEGLLIRQPITRGDLKRDFGVKQPDR